VGTGEERNSNEAELSGDTLSKFVIKHCANKRRVSVI
jgi:hypothetical protein